MRMLKNLLAAFIFLTIFGSGCRSPLELSSSHATSPIQIDGSSAEWAGMLTTLESPTVSIGFHNDEDYLSLCLTTTDRSIQAQILFAGLTVWFDSEQSDSRPLGIQFPLVQDRPVRTDERDQLEDIFRAFEPRMHTLLVLDGSERQQFSVLQAPGIHARIGLTNGLLVYELQVPAHSSAKAPYAATAGSDGIVRVTLEATERSRDQLPSTGSSRPGGRTRRAPGGGPAAEISGSSRPERFRLATIVHVTP